MDEDVLFSSVIAGVNYQKIANIGSDTVSSSGNYIVSHNLGYIPTARVWYDPGLGKRFPVSVETYVDDTTINSEVNDVHVRIRLTTTQLIIEITNPVGANVTYWWRIYYDN